MKITINMNDTVKVKLNDRGKEIVKENHQKLFKHMAHIPERVIKEDEDGWSKWQLWDLMHEFGSSIHLGGHVPFDTNIELVG